MTSVLTKSLSGLLKTASVVAVTTALFVTTTNAAEESYQVSATKALTLTDWNDVFNLAKFDTNLGTLLSVEITLSSTATTNLTVTNSSGSASSGDVTTRIRLTLATSAVGSNIVLTYFAPDQDNAPTYSINGGQSYHVGQFSGSSSKVSSYTDSTTLANFSGPGTVAFNLGTLTSTSLNNTGGNTDASQVTTSGGAVTVKYTYDNSTAVPEPGTWAALAMGAGLLLASTRFRRRA